MESLGNPRPKLADALANADLLVDRATIDRTIAQMAAPIARDYAGEVPVYLTIDLDYDAVGGLTLGADPVATAMLHAAATRGRRLDAFVVRKQPKH